MEVEELSRQVSPSTRKLYGVARVLAVWRVPRSSFYAARHRERRPAAAAGKPGPVRFTDEQALQEIREILREPVFAGEGYRKVWARLRHKGIRIWKDRVLRLMRENNLLSPSRQPKTEDPHPHDGTILATAPDQIWGTDGTNTYTDLDGRVTVFAAIDHFTAECVGIHAVKKADRFEALDPIRQGIRQHYKVFKKNVAEGLLLRHDHGKVYLSDDFRKEIEFLGMKSSPAFVRQPEGNGCIERFFRTLKEQLLWVRRFRDLGELSDAVREFMRLYNEHWILQRLNYRTPAAVRREYSLAISKAA